MAKTVLSDPEYPIVKVDTDEPLTADALRRLLIKPGVTLLIRSATGKPGRGGYYFQIEILDTEYVLHPFDQKGDTDVYSVDFDLLLKLINQMSGRQFDKDAMFYVRHEINMPTDG